MIYRFYLAATGSQSEIQALNEYLGVADSRTSRLRSKSQSNASAEIDEWIWRSPYYESRGEFPEEDLLAFFQENTQLVEKLKVRSSHIRDLVAVIIGYFQEGDEPHGYSISTELIDLLAEIRASLEIDIVEMTK